MRYKPNYCCNCGDKIERTESPSLKHSGRFCDVCKNDFPFQELMPKIFIFLCGLLGILGIGSYLSGGDVNKAVALKESKVSAPQNNLRNESVDNLRQNSNRQSVNQIELQSESGLSPNANKKAVENKKAEVVKTVEDKTYFCGAATKKGTACSRKVKGGGRCWQHEGQDALFPPEKLLITQ